jgi:hypothetical protein
MTTDEAITVFSSFSPGEKKEFLAQLMYELTVIMRGEAYEFGGDGLTDARRARLINEVQHRVSAFLWALLRDDTRRYPDDVFVKLILGWGEDESFHRLLEETFARLAAKRPTAV